MLTPLLVLLACRGGDPPQGALTVGGETVGDVVRHGVEPGPEGAEVTWVVRWRDPSPTPGLTSRWAASIDPAGHLRTLLHALPDGATRRLVVAAGVATLTTTWPDGLAQSRALASDGPVVWPEAGGPWTTTPGEVLVWDGRRLRPARVRPDGEGATVCPAPPDGCWRLETDGAGHTRRVTAPDGAVLGAASAVDAGAHGLAALRRLPSPAIPRARRVDALSVRLGDGPTRRLEAPLRAFLPRLPAVDPAPGPPPDARSPEPVPWPLPLALPDDPDRLAVVEAAVAAVRREARGDAGWRLPRPGPPVAPLPADCDHLAQALVDVLRAHGVVARVVHGVLLRDEPGTVDHAWVEVRGGALGWVPVDPALGAVPADAARIPEAWIPDRPRHQIPVAVSDVHAPVTGP